MNGSGDILLDTSIVIEYLRNQPAIHQRLQSAATLYVPLVVIGELLYGAFKSRNFGKATKEVKDFCRGCEILFPDETTAQHYAEIKVQLANAGTPIPKTIFGLPPPPSTIIYPLRPGIGISQWSMV